MGTTHKVLATALAAWLAAHGAAAGAEGQRIRVVDGDTVVVNGTKVQLRGIDCPESDQPGGAEAAAAIERAMRERGVGEIEDRGRGHWGRTLGILLDREGRSLNRWLVEEGHAWAYYDDGAYEEAERRAREARRGLWRQGGAVPPGVWRRQ